MAEVITKVKHEWVRPIKIRQKFTQARSSDGEERGWCDRRLAESRSVQDGARLRRAP